MGRWVHANTVLLFNKYAKRYFRPNTRVLEVGPGRPPSEIQLAVRDSSIRWETAGTESAYPLTYVGSEYSYPIESDAADVVVATNVMEHVRKPWVWIRELARICRPKGYVITINPVSWPYHEYPVDCWRAYPDGMKALYDEAHLTVITSCCESLEDADFHRHIPGRSVTNVYRHGGWRIKSFIKLAKLLQLPVERPYDTVTVGQK
jgi:SAM-dependent methyltransferase